MNYLLPLIKPTRLYIKKCSHCNLHYFGKHVGTDIEKYRGSGIRWNKHLDKHNANALHVWHSDWYKDNSIIEVALKFSKENKIVESDSWANLVEENGVNGGDNSKNIDYEKTSNSIKNKYKDQEWLETVGKNKFKKISDIQNDPLWKETTGKLSIEKRVANCDYKEVGRKGSETKNSKEWKEKTYKTCEHCNKGPMLPTNYYRWHGTNCKNQRQQA